MNTTTKSIRTWKNKEGNLCFSYNMKQPMEKPLIIIIIGACIGTVILAEYLCFNTTYSLFPLLFLFMFTFMYWCVYPCKDNEVVEEMMMNKNVNLRLHNELKRYDKNVYEVKRKFHQDTKGTYGIITGTYMLVLLSNGEILEYELKYHKPTKTEHAYHEFIKRPIQCINPEHKKVIEIRSLIKWWTQITIPEKVKLSLIILAFVSIGIVLTSLYSWIIIKLEWKAIVFFIGYIVIFMLLQSLISKSKNRIVKTINFAISLPIVITKILFNLMHPTIIVLMSYMCLGAYAFGVPIVIVIVLNFLLGLNISWETMFFITLAVGSIISVHGAKFIHWMIKEHSPLKNWENHKYEAVQTELALYVINKNNVNFLIYLAYFLFLSVSGLMQIQYNEPLITTNIDSAILKAFLVFIAFSNMVNKSKDVEIKTKPLLDKMIRLITAHDE